MKTTIEISDRLFQRTKRLARHEHTTLRKLVEQGLQKVLAEHPPKSAKFKLPPIKADGGGFTPEFQNAGWEQIRDEIYRGHGA